MNRQEGYYWVKFKNDKFEIAYWDNHVKLWSIINNLNYYEYYDFEHINEVRIKEPGELPD